VDHYIIVYTTKEGEAILYKRATAPLYRDGDEKFALTDGEKVSFLDLVSLRAKTCGGEILVNPISAPGMNRVVIKSLLSGYGEISREKERARAEMITHAIDRQNNTRSQPFIHLSHGIVDEIGPSAFGGRHLSLKLGNFRSQRNDVIFVLRDSYELYFILQLFEFRFCFVHQRLGCQRDFVVVVLVLQPLDVAVEG
jgi:hypothetical protein